MKLIKILLIPIIALFSSSGFCVSENVLALQADAFNKVAVEVGPAVVSVTVVQVYTYGGRTYYYPYRSYDPFLDEFLREFFESPKEYRQSGLGSGVIIDKRGYILTNEHVVSEANEIEVTLSDGRKFKGTVKGSDPRSDLAVIKIDADNLPIAKLGDSEKVKVGEWVVAVGNPFGFVMSNPQPTITAGIVSALHRSFSYTGLDQVKYYGDLIQTDAAINKGNSGGPLVNLKGEIIGINALIYSTTGGYQGIGFAIPINRAKNILEELIEGKEIKYGWLGVQVQSLTPELINLFNLPDANGALVADVIADSPAARIGIHKGDLVKKIDDREILTSDELVSIISHFEVGQKSKIIIMRDGKEIMFEVLIGERPKANIVVKEKNLEQTENWRGMQVIALTPELKKQTGVAQSQGVVVIRIQTNTSVEKSGIREGDVIDEINRDDVKTIEDFIKITEKLSGEVLVHTTRGYFVVKEK
jgi:serine protease Do